MCLEDKREDYWNSSVLHFLVVVLILVVITNAVDCLGRLVSKVTYYML